MSPKPTPAGDDSIVGLMVRLNDIAVDAKNAGYAVLWDKLDAFLIQLGRDHPSYGDSWEESFRKPATAPDDPRAVIASCRSTRLHITGVIRPCEAKHPSLAGPSPTRDRHLRGFSIEAKTR